MPLYHGNNQLITQAKARKIFFQGFWSGRIGKPVLTRLSRSLRSWQETARWPRSRLLVDEMNYYRARANAVLRAVQL